MTKVLTIFDHLGIPARTGQKVTQHVKNIEEVPDSKKAYPMYAQEKKDGVYAMLVIQYGKEPRFFGRTGKQLQNCRPFALELSRLPSGIYLGELCLPESSLEVLSGILNPNRTKEVEPDLHQHWLDSREFHVFDFLTVSEFTDGRSERTWHGRWHMADLCIAQIPPTSRVQAIPFTTVANAHELESYAQALIERGTEGAVFRPTKGDAPQDWVAGHKGYRCMKRVRRIEYDLLCTGVEEGTGKYAGKVANLLFRWRDGQEIKAMLGKGWTHDDAEVMWESREHRYNLLNPIGSIFQVYGLQDSSKGKIRLPKVGELRHDKDEPDY